MKKTVLFVLALLLVFALPLSASAENTRVFVDSVGREVTVPETIEKIAVSGPAAQIVLFALAPDKLVGLSSEWDPSAEALLATEYYRLPVLGQLYGGKGEMNLETLLLADPDVVIDVGEPKGNVKEDLDALSEQTGIPFVHVTSHTDSMDETYTKLGELLGMQQEAQVLSEYCRRVYDRAVALGNQVKKVDLLYVTGLEGLSVIAKDSYHSEVIDMLSNNLAVVESPSSRGTGNEVEMEQILKWNPDVVIFSDQSIYDTVEEDPVWQGVSAIANGTYYEAPLGPYNWMGFPPSVQRLLGMMWMGKLLYPQEADYDLYEEVAQYFDLFYHCDLTREQYDALVAKSIGR